MHVGTESLSNRSRFAAPAYVDKIPARHDSIVLEGGFDDEGTFNYMPFSGLDSMIEVFRRRVIKRRRAWRGRRDAKVRHLDHAGALHAFVQAIKSDEEPESSGRENIGTLALMHSMVKSAESGKPMKVAGDD